MTSVFRYSLLLFVVSNILGCASLTSRGYDALNAGEYEKALSLFQQAHQKNSNDAEAVEGLRTAQQEWLNRKLIDVRLLRLGGNIGDSEKLLLEIIKHENEWQVFPTGVAFSTQKEEISLFSDRVESRINEHLKKSNPLAAQMEFNRNHFILGEARGQNIAPIINKIYASGIEFCKKTAGSLESDEYYTGIWLAQTCAAWKYSVKIPKMKNSVVLFKDVQPKSSVQGFNPELEKILSNNIRSAFILSKWKDPEGSAVLSLEVDGKFNSRFSEKAVYRTAHYSVQVPYSESYKRDKAGRKEPSALESIGGLLNFLAGSTPTEYVQDNFDGTETVTVTKYRFEPRTYNYKATQMNSEKVLEGSLKARLDKEAFSMNANKKYTSEQDRHNENFPEANLTPSNPQFISDAQWIESVSKELVYEISTQLQQSWITRFCDPDLNANGLSKRELINRCAFQVTAVAPENLRQHYLSTWQISFQDWQALVNSR